MERRFCDNSKYFYLYLVDEKEDVKWIATSKETLKQLKELNLPVVYKYSITGICHMLTSGVHITSCYKRETSYLFSIGATYINFWHGLALKKIEYDIKSGPLSNRYNKKK